MSNLTYSRKKRQLKQLSKKLKNIITEDKEYSSDYIQKLIGKIKALINELKRVIPSTELAKALGAIAVFFGLSYTPKLSAQSFASPISNPFGINSFYVRYPAFVDLDGDGDLDLMASARYDNMLYYENTGTPSNPQFASPPSVNPFGITALNAHESHPITFTDLDGDGDFDIMIGSSSTGVLTFIENIGSATNPQFTAPQFNPFGFSNTSHITSPTFADFDKDGDIDLLVGELGNLQYYENIGTPNNPQFTTPQTNPFGLVSVYGKSFPALRDLDNDGDFDLLVSEYPGQFQYFENTGTASNPQFGAPVLNPFGLSTRNSVAVPTFADLDSDGDDDLMVGEYSTSLIYFQNNSPVGLAELPAFEMQLFPNPASEHFKILTEEYIVKVELLDVTGKLVAEYLKPDKTILIKELKTGIYFVKVTNQEGETTIEKLQKLKD